MTTTQQGFCEFSMHKWPHKNLKMWFCSDLLCGTLFPVGGRGGCDVTYWWGGVRTVASSCSARLRGDGGGWHVADQSRAAFHSDVRVPLCGHVEDAEAVVVEARQLALEHTCTSLTSTYTHGRLAVEDGQLPTYMDTHARTHKRAPNTQEAHQEGTYRQTHANTVTHTYIPVVTYVHTYTHKSVWALHNSPPPSHGERMG